ncbi:hypothetical protein ColTof4_06360 [Colletotrichum tofieldiae]|uniref:Transmembrane protein n=1 Tax=Colletotrichum tofieldiae TaxID=708197 RepID=A0A166TVQ3_9PEZI|nr:hypothetical protein CT0861_09372 [Colletotrichum tofieldiae]GKT54207.1 hypothetical protein ColTof3_01546 [Colletotrichum tofieldiae]GKT73937.1 hypothetical protein ColTof4_06360 [Colletotrichum tofieldiae]
MSFQSPFLPWLGLNPWPSEYTNTIASVATTILAPTATNVMPTSTIATMTPTETTEFFKTWAYGEQLSILKWFKGIAGGIAVAFLVASMFCCWAPCIYWYYGGDFTHQDGLDDMTDAILHGQFVPEGGWLPWFRERFAALSQTFEERAEARRRAAVEEGVRVDEAAGDANGYEQNTGMASARNRNEHRETERYSQT